MRNRDHWTYSHPTALERRVAETLDDHMAHPWPGPIVGPGRYEWRCARCGVIAASDFSIGLEAAFVHQARMALAVMAGRADQ